MAVITVKESVYRLRDPLGPLFRNVYVRSLVLVPGHGLTQRYTVVVLL